MERDPSARPEPSSPEPSIIVEDVARAFGAVEAVRGLSFAVRGGEVLGLLGPNGAGKTTTLRMLATLLRPDRGRATVAGFDVRSAPLSVRRNIGYLTGDTGLYERLSPVEMLRYFGALHGLRTAVCEARIATLVDGLAMGSFAGRRCGSLSTGQRQRASVARALLTDPPVLILDEPTAGLDILAARTLLDTLRVERERGKAVLFSTHVMAEAELVCDRIVLLHRGRAIAEGTVRALRARFDRDTLAEAFLAAIALADGENVGGENVGGENVGGENVGGENVGGENVGGESADGSAE
jgi:sodium transport system ATP-binding protein